MIENNFIRIINSISEYENIDNVVSNNKKNVDEIFLHDNEEIIDFYSQTKLNNFIVEKGAGTLLLIDYDDLKEQNSKYSFSNLDAEQYLVFIEKFGGSEPILFNFSESSSPTIYAAYDILNPFKISDDFTQFVDALTVLIAIVYGKYDIFEIYTNDDCDELSSEFLSDINLQLLPILKNNFTNFMKYFYG